MYDLIVIGAGPGGYPAAIKAAEYSKRVAVIEKDQLGGTCLNRGCIPTKTLLHSTALYQEALHGGRFGVQCDGVRLDLPTLWAHKDSVVASLQSGIAQQFKKHKIDHICGTATVTGENQVSVQHADGRVSVHEAEYILIATGSAPAVSPIAGSAHPNVLNSDVIFNQNLLGKTSAQPFASVVIIGGGVIGMEMASVYSNLGSKVTVLEGAGRILSTLDKEIAQNLKMILKKQQVEIVANAMVREICAAEDGTLTCHYTEKETAKAVSAEGILLSTGRKATTEDLFAPEIASQLTFTKGYLCTSETFATTLPSIYAIGDVRGQTQLAHVATAEGLAAVGQMFGETPQYNLTVIPACVYTEPEIASVGISADQAKEQGIAVQTGKYIMSVNGKSVLSLQERGFIKLVTEAESGKLLGAQMMCARATDMIGELAAAIANDLTVGQLQQVIHAHPTFAEGIGEALHNMK